MSVAKTNRPEDKNDRAPNQVLPSGCQTQGSPLSRPVRQATPCPVRHTCAWGLVKRNRAPGGIHGQTLEDIEAYGADRFLEETAQAVREQTYRPVPVRRAHTPKTRKALGRWESLPCVTELCRLPPSSC